MKALLIEDDKKISSFIQKEIKEQGGTVELCDDGSDGYLRAPTSNLKSYSASNSVSNF